MDFDVLYIKKNIDILKGLIFKQNKIINNFYYKECDYKSSINLPLVDDTWKLVDYAKLGKKYDSHCWIYKNIILPEDFCIKETYIEISTGYGEWDISNPQFLVYINGKAYQGLDINHTLFKVPSQKNFELMIYCYSGTAIPNEKGLVVCNDFNVNIRFVMVDKITIDCYYDILTLYRTLEYLDTYDEKYIYLKTNIIKGLKYLDYSTPYSKAYYESISKSSIYINDKIYNTNNDRVRVKCIGHTHIDIAWLWTIKQTKEKAQRSFSTVLNQIDRFPEYKFISSQAILYKMVKESDPVLYSRIKDAVKKGNWEVDGAMWLESDCNLISGESLIRQIMFGKKFFKDEFDIDSKVLWLPDTFGFPASMPQILKKCGINQFVTSKLSWNDTNTLPNDCFYWKGIDGSDIFTYFLTAQNKTRESKKSVNTTYNGIAEPAQITGTYERFQNKDITSEVLFAFGYGDGGGGATDEFLETLKRTSKGVVGVPITEYQFVSEFLNNLETKCSQNKETPSWVGELYLELHRGTYTTMAKNKLNNRRSEFLLHNVEFLSCVDMLINKSEYPSDKINQIWEIVLTNQFHDILPGSAIKEVYEQCDKDYLFIKDETNYLINDKIENILKNFEGKMIAINSNGFIYNGFCKISDNKYIYVENIPSYGFKEVELISDKNDVNYRNKVLENKFYKIKFNDDFSISSIFDKEADREVLVEKSSGNNLIAYEDYPYAYDAWEIAPYYNKNYSVVNDVQNIEFIDEGAKAGIKITRRFRNSKIEQKILISYYSRTIDFDSNIDWKEKNILLKTEFNIDVNTTKAIYDIQFGNFERENNRNTSWQKAKFEVCAHKYADLSDNGYGVSLINDCKYGYGIEGNKITLSLLKSPVYPNFYADKCNHKFTYSLYPHASSFIESDVIKEAYKLNNPIIIREIKGQKVQGDTYKKEFSFVKVDKNNIVIETIKKSEISNSIIVRMYETFNKSVKATISFSFNINKAIICDMLENDLYNIDFNKNQIELKFKPFEIITLKIN